MYMHERILIYTKQYAAILPARTIKVSKTLYCVRLSCFVTYLNFVLVFIIDRIFMSGFSIIRKNGTDGRSRLVYIKCSNCWLLCLYNSANRDTMFIQDTQYYYSCIVLDLCGSVSHCFCLTLFLSHIAFVTLFLSHIVFVPIVYANP